MQISDGIWRVDGLRAANVYLIAAPNGVVIVDSGISNSERAILAELKAAGYSPQDVRVIVITHAHIDHIGSLPALHSATAAPVAASAGEAAAIDGRAPLPHPPGGRALVLGTINRMQRPQPVAVQHLLHPGAHIPDLPGWHVVPTPGHTPDHVSLYHPQRAFLIAGDALANFGRLRGSPWLFTSNMRQAQASVAELAGLPIQNIACGHGAPIVADPSLPDQLAALARRGRFHR